MKKYMLQLASLLGLTLAIAVSDAQAQSVCLYEHSNYQGRSTCFNAGDQVSDLVPYGMNDQVSSIAIYGRTTVTVCEHSYMGGRCLNFNQSVSDLVPYGFNDTMSSLAIGYGGGYPQPYPQPQPQPQPYPGQPYPGHPHPHPGPGPGNGGQVCFFEHSYFGGRSVCLNRGQSIANLSAYGFNDAISSIQVSGWARVTICEHDNFNGQCRTFNSSVQDLVPYGFNDLTTSIAVQ